MSPQSRQSVESRKAERPVLDRRSKTILDVLQSKRLSREKSERQDATPQKSNAVGRDVTQDANSQEKVITYPKFVVSERSEKQSPLTNRKKVNFRVANDAIASGTADASGFCRSKSVRYAGASHQNRDAQARRSLREPRSNSRDVSTGGAQLNQQVPQKLRMSNSTLDRDLHDQSVDDVIAGLLGGDDVMSCLQSTQFGRSNVSAAAAVAQQYRQSPAYEHPPPPTPASQLLLQLGFDASDPACVDTELQYEQLLRAERSRKIKANAGDKGATSRRRDSGDPGVSNTTQNLLDANIIKRHFIFPSLSSEAHRKNIGTPRALDKPVTSSSNQAVNMGSSRALTTTPVNPNSNDVTHAAEKPTQKDELHVVVQTNADVIEAPRSMSSLDAAPTSLVPGMTRSHSFFNCQGSASAAASKSRALQMGVTRVSIDVDNSHLTRSSQLRRSLELRQKTMHDTVTSPDAVDGRRSTLRRKQTSHSAAPATRHRADRNGSGHLQFSPPPNTPSEEAAANVFHRRSTVRKKTSKLPVRVEPRPGDGSRGAVGVSFFKMVAPGVVATQPDSTKHKKKPYDAQKFVFGVTTDEIAL